MFDQEPLRDEHLLLREDDVVLAPIDERRHPVDDRGDTEHRPGKFDLRGAVLVDVPEDGGDAGDRDHARFEWDVRGGRAELVERDLERDAELVLSRVDEDLVERVGRVVEERDWRRR